MMALPTSAGMQIWSCLKWSTSFYIHSACTMYFQKIQWVWVCTGTNSTLLHSQIHKGFRGPTCFQESNTSLLIRAQTTSQPSWLCAHSPLALSVLVGCCWLQANLCWRSLRASRAGDSMKSLGWKWLMLSVFSCHPIMESTWLIWTVVSLSL